MFVFELWDGVWQIGDGEDLIIHLIISAILSLFLLALTIIVIPTLVFPTLVFRAIVEARASRQDGEHFDLVTTAEHHRAKQLLGSGESHAIPCEHCGAVGSQDIRPCIHCGR